MYLIFDRYYDYSIKGTTRAARAKNIALHHKLELGRPVPSRNATLGSTLNKTQQIERVSEYIASEIVKHPTLNRIFITSAKHTPTLVYRGEITQCMEMETSHEEADVIIVQQCFKAIESGCTSIKVISDDTDVFAQKFTSSSSWWSLDTA